MSKLQKNTVRISVSLACFFVAFICFKLLGGRAPFWAWLIVFLSVYIAAGYDVFVRAVRNIAHGRVFDEHFLMIVATIGAFVLGEYAEAVAVMLFYQVGELFQSYAVGKSRRSIAALMDICPESACVVTDGGEEIVSPDEVEVGSLIVVRAGEKVPIDGIIESGSGYLDCSALTGESEPVAVAAGDEALSGAISTSSVLNIRTTKPYADSTVAKILDLVENASSKKAKTENFITRFALIYTPAVVFSALILAILPPLIIGYNAGSVWREWVTRALTFLVVSCPCALVISVPMSFFGGIGAASRRGILVKGGNYLELLGKTDTIVFDKTGTITEGKFAVVNVFGDRREVLTVAARAECGSLHPIAQSITSAAREQFGFQSDRCDTTELAGMGIVAKTDNGQVLCGNRALMEKYGVDVIDAVPVGTVVYVAVDGKCIGAIDIADRVKPDSTEAIASLKADGIKTVMLTGDRAETADRIAREVGIDSSRAQLLPADKVTCIENIIEEHGGKGKVAFVGDGINDAPVLSRSDVGIAMGALGSDAAIEAADIVLMNDKLSQIVTARRIAKKTVRIALQNIIFALSVKAVILVLAACGIASMWLAVFGDVGVAVIAILNAMRCLRVGKRQSRSSLD